MNPIPAIVEPAQIDLDLLEKQIAVALAGERDAVRTAERHEGLAANARETARMRRLEVGRMLLKARGAWPKSGPKAKGWSELLARLKLDDSTAVRYMDAARTSDVHGEPPRRSEAADSAHGGEVSQNSEGQPGPTLSLVPALALTEQQLLEALALLDQDARSRIQRSLRAKQARENEGDRDAYCTPGAITALLPRDRVFDPCSNPRSTVWAQRRCSLENGEDGLATPWADWLIYANVPYSAPLPWAEKLDAEYPTLLGAGFLVNADHSPRWWKLLAKRLGLRLDFDERLQFDPPPGVEPSKNDRPQTLLMDEPFWAACSQVELLKLGTLWRQHTNP